MSIKAIKKPIDQTRKSGLKSRELKVGTENLGLIVSCAALAISGVSSYFSWHAQEASVQIAQEQLKFAADAEKRARRPILAAKTITMQYFENGARLLKLTFLNRGVSPARNVSFSYGATIGKLNPSNFKRADVGILRKKDGMFFEQQAEITLDMGSLSDEAWSQFLSGKQFLGLITQTEYEGDSGDKYTRNDCMIMAYRGKKLEMINCSIGNSTT